MQLTTLVGVKVSQYVQKFWLKTSIGRTYGRRCYINIAPTACWRAVKSYAECYSVIYSNENKNISDTLHGACLLHGEPICDVNLSWQSLVTGSCWTYWSYTVLLWMIVFLSLSLTCIIFFSGYCQCQAVTVNPVNILMLLSCVTTKWWWWTLNTRV